MRKIILLIILAIGVKTLQAFETKIPILKGEKWWGAGTHLAPMLVSSEGRYLWSGLPMKIAFESDAITVSSVEEKIEVIKAGKTLREAYLVCCHRNFPPVADGKQLPLELFTRPVYETGLEFGLMHTQEGVLDYARRIVREGLPVGTIVLSEGWSKNNGSFDFDREYYPDPRAMTQQLHEMGFKLMLTVTPLVATSGRGYLENIRQRTLVFEPNNVALILKYDAGYGACLDLTNPAKVADIKRQIGALQSNFGVDGFRFDACAVLPALDKMKITEKFLSGWLSLGEQIDLCEYLPWGSRQVDPRVCNIRSATTSTQEYLSNVVVAGLSGFPYIHPLVESQDADKLFANQMMMTRTMQLSMMMPVASVDFAPWRVTDPKLAGSVKQIIALRSQLVPYIEKWLQDAHKTAEPLIRNMEYMFPRAGFTDCNDQFMLGDKYLFAPVMDDLPKRTVRLPRGVWVDSAGKRFKGPVVISVDVSGGRMPYFEIVK